MVTIAIGSADPFKDATERKLEFFNETMIMIAGYHLFCFTDFVPDVKIREKVGLSLMACTIFCVVVNILVVFKNPI